MKLADLIAEARKARTLARAAYSGFKVGAALETKRGRVYRGCNIENATYGLTVCAERVALWKALSEGESEFRRMVVVADSARPTPPCGACRQILWEYCGDLDVYLASLGGRRRKIRLAALFPSPFDGRFLGPE